jgi:hypothetical protein
MFHGEVSWKVKVDYVTVGGFAVDNDSTWEIDNVLLDARAEHIEQCLKEVCKDAPPTEPWWDCNCSHLIASDLKRDCIVVKIVEPIFSRCSDWQFVPIDAPQRLCDAKGLEENPECPCRWRWYIQDQNVLITPPALYLYDLVRMHTTCNAMWFVPELAACASSAHAGELSGPISWMEDGAFMYAGYDFEKAQCAPVVAAGTWR